MWGINICMIFRHFHEKLQIEKLLLSEMSDFLSVYYNLNVHVNKWKNV